MKSLLKILPFLSLTVLIYPQELDTLLNRTVQDFLLHDTIYVTKTETTFVAQPETIIVKPETVKKKDTSSVKVVPKISQPKKTQPGGSFLDQLKIVGQITFWTVLEILLIVLIGYILIKILDTLKNSPLAKERLPILQSVFVVARAFIWLYIIYLIMNLVLGDTKEITLIIVIVAIIVIGVSLIPLIKNFIGGIFISVAHPFEKGNYIKISEHYGEVQKIGWRSTKILTNDNNVVFIPNSLFLTQSVENINIGKREQLITLEFEFPFTYESRQIVSLLKDAAISSPYTYSKKEAKVYLSKSDFINEINKYEVNLYLFDARYDNELIDSINNYLLNELNNKDTTKE